MKMKKSKSTVVPYYICLSLCLTSLNANSAGVKKPKVKKELKTTDSPYSSCKNAKLVSVDQFEEDKNYWNSRCKEGEKIQIMPKTGKLVTDLQSPVASLALLQEIGAKFQEIFDSKIKEKHKILDCFKFDRSDKECKEIRKREILNTYATAIKLRQELALAEGEGPTFKGNRGTAGSLIFPSPADSINSSLSKKLLGASGVYRPDDIEELNAQEKTTAENQMQSEIESIKNKTSNENERKQLYLENQKKHKDQYLKYLEASPILLELGKLPAWDKYPDRPNDLDAVNAAFSKAYTKLLDSAKEHQEKIAEGIKESAVLTAGTGIGTRNDRSENSRAKDLLSVMDYQNIVDLVIAEHPNDRDQVCALATSLLKNREDDEFRTGSLTAGAMMAGAIVATIASNGLALPLVGGVGLTGSAVGAATVGIAMGVESRHEAQKTLDQAKGAVSVGAVPATKVDEADGSVALGPLLAPLDIIGAGVLKGAGSAAFKSVAKKALMENGMIESRANQLIKFAAEGDKKAIASVNEVLKDKVGDLFKSKEEAQQIGKLDGYLDEILKLKKEERQGVMKETLEILKDTKLDLVNNKKEFNDQLLSIVKYGKVNDPKKVAAILQTWDDQAKRGLKTTYDDAKKILDDPSFMPGASIDQKREAAFKKALLNKNIAAKEADDMCACANVCSTGKVTDIKFIDKEKLGTLHVCVQDQNTIWYLDSETKKLSSQI
jgi:hypothetical protein